MRHAAPSLKGMFTHPCGVWVAPYRFSGAVWFAPLIGVTRVDALRWDCHE